MANHYEDTFPFEGDLEIKRKIVIDALNSLNWGYKSINNNEFEARLYFSVSSWGEKVHISFNEKSIYIRSKSLGITMADWGKNKNNVLKFITELNSVIKKSVFTNESSSSKVKNDNEEPNSFIDKILNVYRLYESKILNDEEYRIRKKEIINTYIESIPNTQPEDFLLSVLPLKEKGIIDDEDIKSLKSILFSKK